MAGNKIYCKSARETGDAIDFKQQLNTTSFKAFELEIMVNYPVHTGQENNNFTRNLTS